MATITYIVKIASSKFTIDDAVAPKLTFRDGDTYVFDQADSSNSGHILQFSATANNSGSSEYTTGVTKAGTPGSAGAKTTIVTSGSTTDTLYYYSSGGGDHGSEFSNSGFKTSSNFNFLKPIIGGPNTSEKWGSMVNHAIDQIDQNISAQDLDGATDSGTVAVDLDTQSLTVAGSNGIATSGSGQTITVSGEALAYQGKPHIIPNKLYPAVEGFLEPNSQYSFTDGSTNAAVVTPYGTDVRHHPGQKKFQNTSIKLNGVDDYITVPNNADFDWDTGDFTVEMWFMPYGALGTAECLISTNNTGGTDSEFYLRSENGRLNWARGADNLSLSTSDFDTLNTWYHIAYVNASGTITCYKNGTSLYSFSAGSHDYNPDDVLIIGARQTGGAVSQFGQYYIDDVRVTKGLAVYTGNFTAPTGALTKTWSANPFGGSNTVANTDEDKVGLLLQSTPTGFHSGNYGTAQADGRSYYYTDIKGSKPIKDPRIGGHFGSQRHKIKSSQLLEQETAIQGNNVYSLDGREWLRLNATVATLEFNRADGVMVGTGASNTSYFEIVGYFSDINLIGFVNTADRGFNTKVDGGSVSNENNSLQPSVVSPLGTSGAGRYVDAGAVVNCGLSQTLGIHTVRITPHAASDYVILYGIELIAQEKFTDATCDYNDDPTITHNANTRIVAGLTVTGTGIPANATVASVTSSTEFELSAATTGGAVTDGTLTFGTNNIQIPSQNVVSYGKKFTVSDNPHYDPFNGMSGAKTLAQLGDYIDTATSLGMDNWKGGTSNYYRPFQGGRVVKWVDSSGAIKTSVTMMPPNAQSTTAIESNAFSDAEVQAGTNDHTITFSPGAVDHSLSEVAKNFHVREFGNGAANSAGGGGTSNTYADASVLSSTDGIAYNMDDGLTCVAGSTVSGGLSSGLRPETDGNHIYFTFIGTGISTLRVDNGTGWDEHDEYIDGVKVRDGEEQGDTTAKWVTAGINLPYGTHVYSIQRTVVNAYNRDTSEVGFLQPKKPPIPEDCVVLADYMLMADFVKKGTAGIEHISKGTRRVHCSRDFLYNNTTFSTSFVDGSTANGGYAYFNGTPNSGTTNPSLKVPVFATNGTATVHGGLGQWWVDGVSTADSGSTAGNNGAYLSLDSDQTLGVHDFEIKGIDSTANSPWCSGIDVATPIHTSSHYQTFETPFLHELVGGDRNMEQTNLVVTADGKTWDEVTRDTSYIGNIVLQANSAENEDWPDTVIFTRWRGGDDGRTSQYLFNKDFAIAYDRMICLKTGFYRFVVSSGAHGTGEHLAVFKNGVQTHHFYVIDSSSQGHLNVVLGCMRGDYLQVKGTWQADMTYQSFHIERA